jgi:hypothetical protein
VFSTNHSTLIEALGDNLSEEIASHGEGSEFANISGGRVVVFIAESVGVRKVGVLIEFHVFGVLVHLGHESHNEKLVIKLSGCLCVLPKREREVLE